MESNLAVIDPEIENRIMDIAGRVWSLKITDTQTYLQAGEIFTAAKAMVKEIEARFKPLKKAQDEAKRKILDWEKEELAKVQPAVDYLQKAMTAYRLEQERIRKAEEECLREEARKAEEERRLAEALEAEREGDKYTAEALLSEPVFVPPVILEPATPKVTGIAMRGTWDFEVTSLIALVKAVAEGKAPLTCLTPNDTFLRSQARAGKGAITYPGVHFYEKKAIGGARR